MLIKDAIDISFAKGLDTKTDPKRVTMGNFVALENSVFNKAGLLQKRKGYGVLAALPDASFSYLTTLNDNLTAVGTSIAAYSDSNASWVSKGTIQPLTLRTLPMLRNNLNQTACDAVVAPNGLMCVAYLESDGTTTTNKYAVLDSVTGQNIVAPTVIPVTSGTVSGGMRVFVQNSQFVIVFTNTIAGTPHLQYIYISTATPTVVTQNADIASAYVPTSGLSWDGVVVGSNLYIAYNNVTGGQNIKLVYLSSFSILSAAVTFAGEKATIMSVTADVSVPSTPRIYFNYYDSTSGFLSMAAVDNTLSPVMGPVAIPPAVPVVNITAAAQNGVCRVFYEVTNAYAWAPGIPTNFVRYVDVTVAGSISATVVSARSVGLASKAFIVAGVAYYLSVYSSPYQPTYFLINGTNSTSAAPVISAKLAYANGGGYLTTGLPSATVSGTTAAIAYRIKDLIQAVNKNTAVPTGSQVAGIYSQTGLNLVTFDIGAQSIDTAEIGAALHISGGFLWMYDGYLPVEHNFFLWPDTDQTTPTNTAAWSATGGSMAAQPGGVSPSGVYYYYQFVYEWTDNAGNAHRSAPSIPIPVSTTGAGTTGSVALNIPTLRLTAKTANPVKIVVYRWSAGQQSYYQVTSITAPLLNSTIVDTATFVDTLADATILGNNLLYTTGGVVEDVNAPASALLTLFDTRLWLVDAEDPNLLWFSKQVIEATPVEMSDLFTMYIPPTTAAQGSTGPLTTLAAMDDKLILFKRNAAYYINGSGPDNTGANNQYSQPVFITATVGCANQQSIAFMPQGLMFQSDKGIWLLDRGLGTSYIGAPVEALTDGATVMSAQNIPGTNQVRFVLDTGVTLMYDYYYGQWGSFTGVPAISSCIFEDRHTFINARGVAFQESVNGYVDGGVPVLMSFTTGPLRLSELQHYQRAYFFYLLGDYISPHKLAVSIMFDYSPDPSQVVLISPTNYSTPYGAGPSQSPYGQGDPYGGPGALEQWRVFLSQQRCQAFAFSVQEVYDSTIGADAGAGLTLSGINVVCGFKKKFRPIGTAASIG